MGWGRTSGRCLPRRAASRQDIAVGPWLLWREGDRQSTGQSFDGRFVQQLPAGDELADRAGPLAHAARGVRAPEQRPPALPTLAPVAVEDGLALETEITGPEAGERVRRPT